jgi:hypothetical protein
MKKRIVLHRVSQYSCAGRVWKAGQGGDAQGQRI